MASNSKMENTRSAEDFDLLQLDEELAEIIYLQQLYEKYGSDAKQEESQEQLSHETGVFYELPAIEYPERLEKENQVPNKEASRIKQLNKTKTEEAKEEAHAKYIVDTNEKTLAKKIRFRKVVKKAIRTGDISELKTYLQLNPADINDILHDLRYTAIGLASIAGNSRVVEFLLCEGADPTQTGMSGTALDFAVAQEHHEIIELLMNSRCDDIEKLERYWRERNILCVKSANKTIENEQNWNCNF